MADDAVIYNSPEYVERYANHFRVDASSVDFLFRFGSRKRPIIDGDPLEIEYTQGVLLSPSEAKSFAEFLSYQVAQYEAAFGAIPALVSRAPSAEAVPGGPTPEFKMMMQDLRGKFPDLDTYQGEMCRLMKAFPRGEIELAAYLEGLYLTAKFSSASQAPESCQMKR